MTTEKNSASGSTEPETPNDPLPDRLVLGALCGSYACNGCYEIEFDQLNKPIAWAHPPRPNYEQKRLLEMDGECSE